MQTVQPIGLRLTPSLITKVRVKNWGNEVVLECLDDPLTRRRYQLVYQNCRDIRWTLHDAEASQDAEADVIGLCPGQAAHAEPAILTTDIFELAVLYERLEVRELPSRAE